MQSFGDDTLLACISIEKKYEILQEQNGDKILQEKNESDLGKYFKQSLLLSEFVNKDDDVDKSKVSHAAHSTKRRMEKNKFDFAKNLEDVQSKSDDEKHFPSTSNVSKRNKVLSSQKNRNSHKKNNMNVNMACLKKKHLNIINHVKNCDRSSSQNLHKNKSNNYLQVARSPDNIEVSLSSNGTYENSDIILSRPLCTQDQCKLTSWSLPPNILQVYYFSTLYLMNMYDCNIKNIQVIYHNFF